MDAAEIEGRHAEPKDPSGETGDTVTESGAGFVARTQRLARAVRDGDDATLEDAILQLSRRRRLYAPLAFMATGLVTLIGGLRLLVSNWRLTLVQILPATWIWVAMFDWKAHVLHDKSFYVVEGPILIPVVVAIAAVTAASFFLNAVFGFAISGPAPPQVRPAFTEARSHLPGILVPGIVVGLLLGFASTVVTRWGTPWFTISMGAVIGVMMICYVAVPARLIGVKAVRSRREKLTITAVGGAMGAVVSTPPYILGRIGALMLGSSVLLIPGIVLLAFAAVLQAGGTGAVKAVKMSTKLAAPRPPDDRDPPGAPVEPSGDRTS